MEDNVTLAKACAAGLIAAGTALWGWFGWMVILWIACMVLISVAVMAWYILTEPGSIAENAVQMGAKVSGFLRKLLKVSADAVEHAGDQLAGKGDDHDGK